MGEIEFKNPSNYIFFLIPVLCLVILILSVRKKDKIVKILKIDTAARFTAAKLILTVLGIALMSFAALGPQRFSGYTEIQSQGLSIYILMDTSTSMLVQDVLPDRISRAKKIVSNILDKLGGDRIGFIPFSSDAYIQMPLTDDYNMARMFLDVIDTDMTGGGGTDIAAAVRLAHESFDKTMSADRVIIILSDGEEHQTSSVNVLKNIRDEQMKIYTIGIGTVEGGMVPEYDSSGTTILGYKMDAYYETVVSRLRPELLKKLAAAGDGIYYQSSLTGVEADSLVRELSSLKRDSMNTKKIRDYELLYQYFLGAGMLLLLVSCLLPERRRAE